MLLEKWRNWKRIRQTDKKGQSCRDNAKTRLPLPVRLRFSPRNPINEGTPAIEVDSRKDGSLED